MAKIDTEITTGSITSINKTPSVSVGSGGKVIDSNADILAKTLSSVNSVLGDYVEKKTLEKGKEKALEGANAINGVTLEEAKELHKAGFPDIKNEWARYGAYKQYASNSSDNFVFEFQKEYLENQYSKDWNWQTALAEKMSAFNEGKRNDVYWESAMVNANETIKRWVNGQELEKESKLLTERVNQDTAFAITTIPEKIATKLEVQFHQDYAMPYDYDTGEYELEKQKYFLENFSKMWDEELQIIKDNLNPAITLSDLDGLIIEAGESHIATDGRFASFYKKMITERRPDNTPAIIENPKWNEAAEALLEKIDSMEGINNFEADFMSGNLQNYDNADYNKMSSELIEQKIKMVMATNKVDSAQAFEIVVEGLLPAIKDNPPIPYLKDILSRNISRNNPSNPQSRLALSLAVMLHKNGMLGSYFNKDNKMSTFWSIAVMKAKAGNQSPDEILKELAQYSGNFKSYTTLVSENKEEFKNTFSNLDMLKPKNKQIIYSMGEYFKNVVGDGWETALKDWVDINYEEYNEVLYSKNELQELGINAEDYDASKVLIAKLLAKKLNLTSDVIDSDWNVAELNAIVDYNEIPESKDKEVLDLIIDNYELIINTEDGELSLAVKQADFEYQLPATMTTTDGTFWLTIPKAEFKAELMKIKTEMDEKLRKEALEKSKIKKRNRLISNKVLEQTKEIMP
tara:strand:+ start:282 stop:2345 length:2064 start_codon:yes stop_codon:yes gene_type:complete